MLKHLYRSYACMAIVLSLLLLDSSVQAVNVTLDYTYDTSNFFGSGNPDGAAAGAQAKAALEYAANFYSDILTDTFSEIRTPEPFVGELSTLNWAWNATFSNPSGSGDVSINAPVISADEYRIYAGAESIGGSTLGVGGPGGRGYSSSTDGPGFYPAELNQIDQISADFLFALDDREESSGFANWGGAITFDRDGSTNWHYDHTASPSSGESDFLSVAIHELGHALGLGTSDEWFNWVSGTSYNGPNAMNEYGGQVPLVCTPGCGHWANGTQSVVLGTSTAQEAALDPNITTGTRKLLTALDAAALVDIGWTVEAPTIVYASADYDTDGDVDGGDLATLQNWYGVNANGDTDGDGDTDGADFLTWQRQYTGTITPLVANVPEPSSLALACLLMLLPLCRR